MQVKSYMKTDYIANDGRIFNNKVECLEYEIMCAEVTKIFQVLGPPVEDSNHYKQHNSYTCLQVRKELLELIKTKITHEWVQQSIDDPTVHISYVARLVDDSNCQPLNAAMYRLQCIDSKGREFQQPYHWRSTR